MKPSVQHKPGDSPERDSGVDGTGTLSYVEAHSPLRDEDEQGSGVRKIAEAKAAAALQSEPAPDARDAQQVGPYRLIECIGEGAMGHVYRAEHTLLGRVVGIKMLRAELTCEDACVRRFLAEARAVNLIKHPHIIDVTDFASTPEGRPWFVMEMLEGSDLLLAASHEPLSLKRTLEIVRQLCDALAAVHAAGIVHRDVKPENIFLQQREGEDFVTLLDFGIARLPDPVNADPLQEGLVGTSYYMAPEQASASPIDHRADLYAVGSTLFELVAGMGQTPFRAEHLQQQLLQVMMTPAPRLSDRANVPAIVRKDLDVLVDRLLAKEPSERPSSASEVADELARIAKKLDPASSGRSDAIAMPMPMLRKSDALASRPRTTESRKRARRAARTRSAGIARWAIVLSAIAAAAALWIATREANWAQAVTGAFSGDDGAVKPTVVREHVVEPMRAAPVISVPEPEAIESPLPVGTSVRAIGDDARKGDARRARRAPRAKPRAQSEASEQPEALPTPEPIVVEQPALTIEPAAEPEPEPEPRPELEPKPELELPVADDGPSIDRDVVLNPFEQ
jgi:serine/threonine-protein kinase